MRSLIGGIDRLERHYTEEAGRLGIELRVFNEPEANLPSKLKNVDAIIIFTGKVSHHIKREAVNTAKTKDIPVFMAHSCGVCTLRDCLGDIKTCPLKDSCSASGRVSH